MTHHPNENIMRFLIKQQWEHHSIYAAIVDQDMAIIAIGTTTVQQDNDPSAHAEINAIRLACDALNTPILPKGYWLYSTFEPCPLCSSAIIWSGLDGVVYANNPSYRGHLENWSFITCEKVLNKGSYLHQVQLHKNFLLDEIKNYFTRND